MRRARETHKVSHKKNNGGQEKARRPKNYFWRARTFSVVGGHLREEGDEVCSYAAAGAAGGGGGGDAAVCADGAAAVTQSGFANEVE